MDEAGGEPEFCIWTKLEIFDVLGAALASR